MWASRRATACGPKAAARDLGIPKAYGSYEEMLADPEIDAVYNPLPNHLHLPWSTRAAEAGKHVLCEKPIGLNVKEALELMAVRDRTGVKIGEAFMVQNHPQWLRIVELVRTGRIGQLRSAVGTFSYFKLDADNIRNIRAVRRRRPVRYRLLPHQNVAHGLRRGTGQRVAPPSRATRNSATSTC